MTVIRPNSISGINSITGNGGDISIFRADGTTGDLVVNNVTTGVITATTFVGNLTGNPTGSGANLTNLPAANLTGTLPAIDGSNLTGIAADKIFEGNTEVETVDTGSDGHVKITTEGSEKARIDSSGNMQVSAGQFTVGTTASTGLQFINDGTFGTIHSADLKFRTAATERLRITSAGAVQLNSDSGSTYFSVGASQDFKWYHDAGGPTIFSDTNNQGLKLSIKELNLTEYTGTTTRLRINSNGIVTKPAQPMLSMTVSSSLLSGNYMTHSSVITNNGTHYNTSNSRFVCPVAGFYYASIMVMSNNSNTNMDLELHKNGSNFNNILVPYQAPIGDQYNQVSGSCIIQCAANDYLQFKMNTGSVYGGRHSNISFCLLA